MQSKHKQTNVNIVYKTFTDYSFLSRYHYIKSKNYIKRRYRIPHWIPMFIGTPCMLSIVNYNCYIKPKINPNHRKQVFFSVICFFNLWFFLTFLVYFLKFYCKDDIWRYFKKSANTFLDVAAIHQILVNFIKIYELGSIVLNHLGRERKV